MNALRGSLAIAGVLGLVLASPLFGQTPNFDDKVTGFGARRQKSDAVSYVVFYRTNEGRQRWHTIGRHGAPWTPDMAREEAKRLLGDVARKLDPAADKRAARNAQTVSELCDLYLADAEAGRLLTRRKTEKKASTLAIDRGRIARHIKPLIGKLKVASVTREDIDRLLHDVAAGKISTTSPIGRCLLNKKVGDSAQVVSPNGNRELEILKLTTIHDLAGAEPQ